VGLLERIAGGKIPKCLVVQAEGSVQGSGRTCLMTGVTSVRHISTSQGRGLIGTAERHALGDVGNRSVVSAAAEHHRVAIPADRHTDLQLDVRSGRIDRKERRPTLQYSMVLPLTTWVTKDADSTRPPLVGKLIADAGISLAANSAHLGAGLPVAVAGAGPRTTVALTNAVASASPAGIRFTLPGTCSTRPMRSLPNKHAVPSYV
jgi:hypothetical protein